jgi:hypothetical protein
MIAGARFATVRQFAHYSTMADDGPFTFTVERRDGRYRWSIFKGGILTERSPLSNATKREAEAEARRTMQKRIAASRSGKWSPSPAPYGARQRP